MEKKKTARAKYRNAVQKVRDRERETESDRERERDRETEYKHYYRDLDTVHDTQRGTERRN